MPKNRGIILNSIRKLVIGTSSLLCVFIVLLFVKSLGINYIVPNNTSYEITGMQTEIDANKFNSAIKNFTKKNNVSAIKVFNVPSKANNSEVTLKSYIYGKSVKLPAGALDNENRDLILNSLKKLAVENKVVLVATHDDKVKKYADQLIDINTFK